MAHTAPRALVVALLLHALALACAAAQPMNVTCDAQCGTVPLFGVLLPGASYPTWDVQPLLSQCDPCGVGVAAFGYMGTPGPFMDPAAGSFLAVVYRPETPERHYLGVVQPEYKGTGIAQGVDAVTELPSFSYWPYPQTLFMRGADDYLGLAAGTAATYVYSLSSQGVKDLCADTDAFLPGDSNKYDTLYNAANDTLVVLMPSGSVLMSFTMTLDGSNDTGRVKYNLGGEYIGAYVDESADAVNILTFEDAGKRVVAWRLERDGTTTQIFSATLPSMFPPFAFGFWNKFGPSFAAYTGRNDGAGELYWGYFTTGGKLQNPVFFHTDLSSGASRMISPISYDPHTTLHLTFISPFPPAAAN